MLPSLRRVPSKTRTASIPPTGHSLTADSQAADSGHGDPIYDSPLPYRGRERISNSISRSDVALVLFDLMKGANKLVTSPYLSSGPSYGNFPVFVFFGDSFTHIDFFPTW